MSLLPAFKLGLWNAWIPMLVIIFHPFLMLAVDKIIGTGNIFQKMGDIKTERRQKIEDYLTSAILYLLCAYSIFLPLKIGNSWFYAGLAFWLIGVIFLVLAVITVATTPAGQIFKNGIFRYSRHPLYLALSVILWSVGVAAASWLFLMITFLYNVLQHKQAIREEQDCLQTFGNGYREYMDQTPRWLGFPQKGKSNSSLD